MRELRKIYFYFTILYPKLNPPEQIKKGLSAFDDKPFEKEERCLV